MCGYTLRLCMLNTHEKRGGNLYEKAVPDREDFHQHGAGYHRRSAARSVGAGGREAGQCGPGGHGQHRGRLLQDTVPGSRLKSCEDVSASSDVIILLSKEKI